MVKERSDAVQASVEHDRVPVERLAHERRDRGGVLVVQHRATAVEEQPALADAEGGDPHAHRGRTSPPSSPYRAPARRPALRSSSKYG
jgi:hypothetical protein